MIEKYSKKDHRNSRGLHKFFFHSCIYLAVVLALCLFLLPFATKYFLVQWFLDNGADQAVIQNIRFNPFTGTASLQESDIRQANQPVFTNSTIAVNVSLHNLFKREARIQEASLENVVLDIQQYENGQFRIGPYTVDPGQATSEQPDKTDAVIRPWIFRAMKIELSNVSIRYRQPKLELNLLINKASLEKFNTDPDDMRGSLTLTGSINGAPISLHLSTLHLVPNVSIAGSIRIAEIQLNDLSALLQKVVHPIESTFAAKGTFNFNIESANKINTYYEGQLDLRTGNIGIPSTNVQWENINWHGKAHYTSAGKNSQIIVQGKLLGEGLNGDIKEPEMQFIQKRLSVHHQLTINTGDKIDMMVNGNITAEQFQLVEQEHEQPLITFQELLAEKVSWSQETGLSCDDIHIKSMKAGFTREKKVTEELTLDENPPKKNNVQEMPEQETTNVQPLRINNIVFSGDNTFTFTDNTLSTNFTTSLDINLLKISNIDSTQPLQPLTYEFEGVLDDNAPLTIKGSALPFAEYIFVEQNTKLLNYSVQNLSPYVVDSIGTTFDSGQLYLTSNLILKDDLLDSKNNIVVKNINARAVDEERQQKLNNQLPVPLNLALSMLRDKEGNIDLNVPLSGPVSELDIGIADILITATSKAIFVGVTPYLAYTVLGPAGALVYLGMKTGQAIIETDLPELKYKKGSIELTDEQHDTLTKAGKIIEKNKEQIYTICTRVSIWELDGTIGRTLENKQKILNDKTKRKQIRDLGVKRSRKVKDYLLSNFTIDKDRLLICDPSIDLNENNFGTIYFLK